MSEAVEFTSLEEAKEILNLMMRHWNTIAGTPGMKLKLSPLPKRPDDAVAEKGARVPLAVCAARTVWNQDQEPFSILEEQLEDFKPRKK